MFVPSQLLLLGIEKEKAVPNFYLDLSLKCTVTKFFILFALGAYMGHPFLQFHAFK